jgi:hypothetical protein
VTGDRELLERTLSNTLQTRREAERELQRRAAYKYANADEAKIEAVIRYLGTLGDAVKALAAEQAPEPKPAPVDELAERERSLPRPEKVKA